MARGEFVRKLNNLSEYISVQALIIDKKKTFIFISPAGINFAISLQCIANAGKEVTLTGQHRLSPIRLQPRIMSPERSLTTLTVASIYYNVF